MRHPWSTQVLPCGMAPRKERVQSTPQVTGTMLAESQALGVVSASTARYAPTP